MLLVLACSSAQLARQTAAVNAAQAPMCATGFSFGKSEPEDEAVNLQQLVSLTEWVQNNPNIPILSFTISKNGKVVYELLTSSLTGEEAHYLMSVTKSVTSSLVGIAIDKGYLHDTEQKISAVLPDELFFSPQESKRFSNLTIKQVLGMSALNALVAPHDKSPEASKRLSDWFTSDNRVRFALTQPLLASPGTDFLYTDVTPSLAAGAVEYATRKSLFDFANENLFQPMQFSNQEWMHEDPSGIDNGAFGLRLRPIDMQKFGNLFLNDGCWGNRQLISWKWVKQSFSPWIGSGQNTYSPDYGWYWWKNVWATGWTSYGAVGWKGQRIEVFPEKNFVVTMTSLINDGTENKVFFNLVRNYVTHLNDPLPTETNLPALKAKLASELSAIRSAPTRIAPQTERRMIPTVAPKEHHIPFNG